MAKRSAEFDRTVWDTGVYPVARGRSEECSKCRRSTGSRTFWVEERILCEVCAGKTIDGGVAAGSPVAKTMLFGMVAMVLIGILYVLLHLSRG